MLAINYSSARQNLKDYCDKVNEDFETIIITRKQGGNAVLMSEVEYNNLMENLFVREDPIAYQDLLKSIVQMNNRQAQRRNLQEPDSTHSDNGTSIVLSSQGSE